MSVCVITNIELTSCNLPYPLPLLPLPRPLPHPLHRAVGHFCNFTVVVARLITRGKDYGTHLFLVQLRSLENHTPMPGGPLEYLAFTAEHSLSFACCLYDIEFSEVVSSAICTWRTELFPSVLSDSFNLVTSNK